MTTHQTRMVLIPADRDLDELHDICDHDTAAQAVNVTKNPRSQGSDPQ